jgi:hypothetical protein
MPASPDQHHHMAGGQAALQRASSASRPTRRGGRSTEAGSCCARRARRRPGPELSMVASSASVSGDGLRADFVLEHLLAAVKGQHRRRAVAAQVVQAHDTPVRVFRQRFGLQQLQRQRQRAAVSPAASSAAMRSSSAAPRLRLARLRRPASQCRARGIRGLQVAQQAGRLRGHAARRGPDAACCCRHEIHAHWRAA